MNTRTLILIFAFSPVVWAAMSSLFDWKITLGELTVFGISLIAVLFFLIIWAWEKYKCKKTFSLEFPSEGYPPSPDGNYDNRYKIPTGEHHILIRIIPNHPLSIKAFNIRFVKSNYWKRDNSVVTDVINICDVDDNDIFDTATGRAKVKNVEFDKEDDTKGGYNFTYNPCYDLSKNEPKFFTIVIKAKQPWNGYISFRGKDKVGNRCRTRRQFKVMTQEEYFNW